MERVETLSRERLAGLSSIIANADPGALSQRMAQGRAVADSIENEFAAMRAEEASRWGQRIAAETTLRKRLSAAMYGGAILSLLAGGLADIGGLLVIIALLAMWIGIFRYTGRLDAASDAVKREAQ